MCIAIRYSNYLEIKSDTVGYISCTAVRRVLASERMGTSSHARSLRHGCQLEMRPNGRDATVTLRLIYN